LDPVSNLFQKVYYAKGLTHEDESKLRTAFWSANNSHQTMTQASAGVCFLGYWPALYYASQRCKPMTLAFHTAAFYMIFYNGIVKKTLRHNLQSSLNFAAEPFADKYGISRDI
jgi:hypothetical protein